MSRRDEVVLASPLGQARVHAVGATVLSWVPDGGRDVLWCSPLARLEAGTAIRGGIPVCWPWFARDPAFPDGPSHGLVRTRRWAFDGQEEAGDAVVARWSLAYDGPAFVPFRVELTVTLAEQLTVALTHHDLGGDGASCRGALHAYLAADARRSVVRGLGPAQAFDKVAGRDRTLSDPLAVEPPLDLVVRSQGLAVLDDGTRRIEVHRRDAPDVVVWNPGAARPGDVPVGGEHGFVCVEAAAVAEPWVVPPGGRRTLGLQLRRPPLGHRGGGEHP